MTTLLDVDADFMLDDDYNSSWCFDDVRRDSKIVISGKKLGNTLKCFKKSDTEIIFETDHHESLFWWDCYGVRDAFCIHIDAHHDMWYNCGVSKGLRSTIDCGNFLQQALADNIVKKVLFVPSMFRGIKEQREDIRCNLNRGLRRRFRIRSWDSFSKRVHKYPKADIITICISPEWFPRQHWHHIYDLAKILGVSEAEIFAQKRKAKQQWQVIEHHKPGLVVGNKIECFKFPYWRVDAKELQRLRSALKVMVVK